MHERDETARRLERVCERKSTAEEVGRRRRTTTTTTTTTDCIWRRRVVRQAQDGLTNFVWLGALIRLANLCVASYAAGLSQVKVCVWLCMYVALCLGPRPRQSLCVAGFVCVFLLQ
jgi:hypothetical protein